MNNDDLSMCIYLCLFVGRLIRVDSIWFYLSICLFDFVSICLSMDFVCLSIYISMYTCGCLSLS